MNIPPRFRSSHKGTFGRTAIVGGCRGMSGAPCLAAEGALRAGAGLVFLFVPDAIEQIAACYNPCYMTIGCRSETSGAFAANAFDEIKSRLDQYDALAIGPGLSVTDSTRELVLALFSKSESPFVVDADALNCLSQETGCDVWSSHQSSCVVTPHPGEFARMIGQSIPKVEANRSELACEFARANNLIVVLKGAGTVVTDGKEIFVNSTGNPGMATGGSGDVLAGVIASLLGQGFAPFMAAKIGVELHGAAGDLAASELSEAGLIASDLPLFVAKAWKHFEPTRYRLL